jgi:uncharacterized membrane protein
MLPGHTASCLIMGATPRSTCPAGGHGFLLDHGVYTTLDPPGSNSSVSGINASGQIVGEYSAGYGTGEHGFLVDNGNYTTFDLPGSGYWVSGINASRLIVGGYNDSGPVHGFLLGYLIPKTHSTWIKFHAAKFCS